MKETTQLKKLMETIDESYYDNNTYDNDSSSGMQDDTRMMFDWKERPEIVLAEVSRILGQFGFRLDITDDESEAIYARIVKD